jgi:hypothetical protein
MDAEEFFSVPSKYSASRRSEWHWSAVQLLVGFWLLAGLAPRLAISQPAVAGWLAMTGVVSVLHFGVSHLLSLLWRSGGVNARHIMDKPVLARSVSDFWGRRWNLAFRDVMHEFVFLPLLPIVGGVWAVIAVFVVSGLIHDAVISFTASGGWGWPTLYFLIQAGAVLVERSRFGKRLGLGRGLIGWLFASAVIAGPAGLLFHTAFIERVVLPMVQAIQNLQVT